MGGVGRQSISLDGVWDFTHASDGIARKITVPMPWQAVFADLRHSSGKAIYQRRFSRPKLAPGQVAVLCFGAVSYQATVTLNGKVLGSHEGGYLPFEIVLPDGLLREENVLEVTCLLPDGAAGTSPGSPFAEIPHGKQSWYGPIGGIWQSVTLDLRDAVHLEWCAISASVDGKIGVALTLSNSAETRLAILDPDGMEVARTSLPAGTTSATLTVSTPKLWHPDHPHIYTLTVDLPGDSTRHSFGLRSFEARDGRLFLNGQPFYMRAALDQDYYPEGIATPPSTAFLEDQLLKAKQLGLNMLRCHIKVPDPRYYEVADRLGMLIWTEIPNVGTFTDASARRMAETMEGILHRDGNHPCIVIWTLINEDWGTRLCEDATHRDWLKRTFDWLKARDPSRLVVDNSPCHGNFHVQSDINDFHYYRSVPERRSEWDALTAEFAAGADWTFTPFGDGARTGTEPLIVSEFGVWGLPNPKSVTLDGAEPWWMETGGTWGDGAAYPHGIQGRFATLGLSAVFGSFDGFIEAAQWYQFANLKYEIEVMRAHAPIQGYVITEFTDVHWESNGLLDMNRNPRVFHDRFASINADVVIVPKVDRYAGRSGQAFGFDVEVATGGVDVPDARLEWRTETGEAGELPMPATGPLAVAQLGTVSFALPQAAGNRMLRIDLALKAGGKVITENWIEIAVYAARKVENLPTVASADAALADYARALGYTLANTAQADVVLSHALGGGDIAALQEGARYVVLADGSVKTNRNLRIDPGRREQPFMPIVDDIPGLPANPESQLPNINLIERHGTMWRGDWIAGFSWIRREGAFADLPGGPLVDLSFDRVIPHHVMTGFRAWEYGGPVHAGIVVGWVHKPAAIIAERAVGKGSIVATTLRLLEDAPGVDPVAACLFDALVRTAANMGGSR